jgi:hypothetical protein
MHAAGAIVSQTRTEDFESRCFKFRENPLAATSSLNDSSVDAPALCNRYPEDESPVLMARNALTERDNAISAATEPKALPAESSGASMIAVHAMLPEAPSEPL